jgi:hypothetical protein
VNRILDPNNRLIALARKSHRRPPALEAIAVVLVTLFAGVVSGLNAHALYSAIVLSRWKRTHRPFDNKKSRLSARLPGIVGLAAAVEHASVLVARIRTP